MTTKARRDAVRFGLAMMVGVMMMPPSVTAQPDQVQPDQVQPSQVQPGQAQPGQVPVVALERPRAPSAWEHHRGWMVGASLGGGTIVAPSCASCDLDRGMAVGASVGYFLKPRFAVMYDVFVVITAEEAVAGANIVAGVAAQYWLTPSIWVKGGVGLAKLMVATPIGGGETNGPGVTAGLGYELAHRGNFALDVQARVSHGDFDGAGMENVAVLFGANWY